MSVFLITQRSVVQIHPPQPTYSTAYRVKRSCFIGHFHILSTKLSERQSASLTSREHAWHTGISQGRREKRIPACTISRWLSYERGSSILFAERPRRR